MKITLKLTDEHISLIKWLKFEPINATSYGIDTYGLWGGTNLYEDMANILGWQDKVIPETLENVMGPRYEHEYQQKLEEYDAFIQKNLDDITTVDDDELIVAFLDMVENHKMVVENSGLLTVAALKHLNVKDKRVVSILSGGNMDVITMSSVVQQGLIFRDRIFTVSVLLPDKPGELAKVSDTLAKQQGNVIKLEHNQFVSTNRSAAVELRITLECFGTEHKEQILKALEKKNYKPKVVRTVI